MYLIQIIELTSSAPALGSALLCLEQELFWSSHYSSVFATLSQRPFDPIRSQLHRSVLLCDKLGRWRCKTKLHILSALKYWYKVYYLNLKKILLDNCSNAKRLPLEVDVHNFLICDECQA